MKTKLKSIVVIFITIMIIGMLPTIVKAEYSAKVTMTPNETEIKPGDTINIVIDLKDVVEAGTGVNEMEGTIEYDPEFFGSITALQGSLTINETNGMFTLGGNLLTEDGQFAILQLKVSEEATESTTVRFTNIKTANGSNSEPTSPDISLQFKIAEENKTNSNSINNIANITNTEKNNASSKNTTDTASTTSTNSIKGDTTNTATSISRLPKAGIKTGMIIAVVILIVLIAGSYILYKYPKIK